MASEIWTHENPTKVLQRKFCSVDKCQLNCDVCITGKLHKKKFCKNPKSAENELDVIHSDVCTKITTQTLGGKQ
jgi:hypothetical protein